MSVQKYRVFQSRLIAIDEYSAFNKDCHSVVVTHADYRVLEEQSAYFRKEWNKAEGKIASLEEELASIKARVDDAYREGFADGFNEGFYQEPTIYTKPAVDDAWENSFAKVDLDEGDRCTLKKGEVMGEELKLCPLCEGTPEGAIIGPSFVQGFCKTCNGHGFIEAIDTARKEPK